MRNRSLTWLALLLALGAGAGCATPGLRHADRLFEERAYREAVQAYEETLSAETAGEHLDRVLFRLALLYTLPESRSYDERRARELLKELVRRVDSGPYREQAARILQLEKEWGECREQLAKLKAIDLDGSP